MQDTAPQDAKISRRAEHAANLNDGLVVQIDAAAKDDLDRVVTAKEERPLRGHVAPRGQTKANRMVLTQPVRQRLL